MLLGKFCYNHYAVIAGLFYYYQEANGYVHYKEKA